MKAAEFTALKGQLTRATPTQLRELHVAVLGLLKLSGSTPEKAAPAERVQNDWLLDGIVTLLKKKGIPVNRNRSVAKSLAVYTNNRGEVEAWFKNNLQLNNPADRMVLGQIAARCLFKVLQKSQKGLVRYSDMLEAVTWIPAAIDDQFPGYAEAGLLGLLLRNARGNAVFGMNNNE